LDDAGYDRGLVAIEYRWTDNRFDRMPALLGTDEGKYSFRQWQIRFSLPAAGEHVLMVRCVSRLFGLLLATVAVKIIAAGLRSLFPILAC
jgi:hypothetical protein